MKLTDLSHNAPFILPPGFSVFRVQRKVPTSGTVKTGPFLTPPVHVLANRFDIAGVPVGYVATDPLTSLYETMARRDVTIVSQGNLRDRWLLELQSGSQLNLLDLRPHAHHWPVLYANRYPSTQALAVDAKASGFDGVLYQSAQQYGSECLAVFDAAMPGFKVVSTQELQLTTGALNTLVVAALRGAELPIGP